MSTSQPVEVPLSPISLPMIPGPFFHLPPATHSERHPDIFVQASKSNTKSKLSEAQKAMLKLQHEADDTEHRALNEDIRDLLARQHTELEELAACYGKKIKYLEKLIGTSRHYKPKRAVNLQNAKIHAKAIELNAGTYLFF